MKSQDRILPLVSLILFINILNRNSVYIDADVVDKKKEPVLTRGELEIEEDQAASA